MMQQTTTRRPSETRIAAAGTGRPLHQGEGRTPDGTASVRHSYTPSSRASSGLAAAIRPGTLLVGTSYVVLQHSNAACWG